MIIIASWNDIATSDLSQGLKLDIRTFYKELVHDNMGEDHLTYDFTEIGKIAILQVSDNIHYLPEIGFYNETILLTESTIEFVDDVWDEDILFYRVTILLNDAEGVVLYVESNKHGKEIENWIEQGREN